MENKRKWVAGVAIVIVLVTWYFWPEPVPMQMKCVKNLEECYCKERHVFYAVNLPMETKAYGGWFPVQFDAKQPIIIDEEFVCSCEDEESYKRCAEWEEAG